MVRRSTLAVLAGFELSGTFNANSGTVSAAFQMVMDGRWDCRYGMRDMKITRQR